MLSKVAQRLLKQERRIFACNLKDESITSDFWLFFLCGEKASLDERMPWEEKATPFAHGSDPCQNFVCWTYQLEELSDYSQARLSLLVLALTNVRYGANKHAILKSPISSFVSEEQMTYVVEAHRMISHVSSMCDVLFPGRSRWKKEREWNHDRYRERERGRERKNDRAKK